MDDLGPAGGPSEASIGVLWIGSVLCWSPRPVFGAVSTPRRGNFWVTNVGRMSLLSRYCHSQRHTVPSPMCHNERKWRICTPQSRGWTARPRLDGDVLAPMLSIIVPSPGGDSAATSPTLRCIQLADGCSVEKVSHRREHRHSEDHWSKNAP